ncbi:hypothetical protein DERP_013918 [Dermatophagoides pteronyssinus]|uniref:Coiled-coil domain-containing protein 134-like n=1 Tax=Dermatophagoides pteronyssinus TaxID=6956 RepID=A0ABQ8JPZ3_DERPT|nr:hypothetical protein DERP_013918 [Dermatophagoides pteronyssinus]
MGKIFAFFSLDYHNYSIDSMIIWFSIVIIFCSTKIFANENDMEKINFDLSNKENIELYFKFQRKQQLNAVQTLMTYDRYEQQYQMVKKLFEKIFHIIDECQQNIINNSHYNIGDSLPFDHQEIVDNIIQAIDNCAFFANMVLKLPDISRRLLTNEMETNWEKSYRWCLNFTKQSNIVDDISLKMFNLAAQQLNIVEKEDDFLNPYEKKNQKSKINSIEKNSNEKKKMAKNSKKIKKGPRMSRIEL